MPHDAPSGTPTAAPTPDPLAWSEASYPTPPPTTPLIVPITGVMVLSVILALAAAFGAVPLASIHTLALAAVIGNVAAAAIPLWLLLRDTRIDAHVRRSWTLLSASYAMLALSYLVTLLQPAGSTNQIAHALNLLHHPVAFAGVLLLPCGLKTTVDRVRLLFEVFITAGAATTLTIAIAPDSLSTGAHGTLVWTSVAPMLGDAVLLGAAAMLWLRGSVSNIRDPLAALVAAFVTHFVVQVGSGVLAGTPAGQAIFGLIVLPFSLVGLCAVRHRHSLCTVGVLCGTTRRLSALPIAAATAVLIALLLITLRTGEAPGMFPVVGGTLVGLAALARQVLGLQGELNAREQSATEQADRRLAALVRHGTDMLTILDPDTTVRYASPSHWSIMGIPSSALLGRRMNEEIHRDDAPAAQLGFERLLGGVTARESMVVRMRDGQGTWRWIEAVGTNLISEPSIGGLVLNSRDITDRKLLESKLLEQALLDPLTQLGNRRMFSDRVSHALARRARHGVDVAVLMLDLDHFKFVNDTLGHAKGDALLIAVADRMRNLLRETDTICRLGGDEFAVLLEDLRTPDEADATAARIQLVLDRAFTLDAREVFVRASIGIALATDGQDVDDLLTDADVAMYSAKGSGRGRVERYSSEMRARVADRVTVEADLRHALERDELDLFYQPLVDLDTGLVVGAEALIRWSHPQHGLTLPGRFIEVAEESDLIVAIGRFVLRRAAKDAARFRHTCAHASGMRVAVNVSARQLRSNDLVDDVLQAMEDAGIPGSALTLELTETVLASNEALVADRLQVLRDWGIRIALDDFGTGYSSLAYLRRFPIDTIKVDKSFVSFGGLDAANDGVTRAIVSIGQSLGMRTIAEGIETQEQLAKLRALGCSMGQGYLFARPLPREAFMHLLNAWNPADFRRPSTPLV